MGIEVFPSLELCGHMEHILSLSPYQEYSEWHSPKEGCLNAASPQARKLVRELVEEVMEFFPSPYVHLGGDETWALGRGRSLNICGVFKGPEIYKEHYQTLLKCIKNRGKIPILWGDMITGCFLEEEESHKWRKIMESELWKTPLLANWDYSPQGKEYFREKIELLAQKGMKQIISPGFQDWARFYPNFEEAIPNLKNFLEAAKEKGVEGFLVTSWGDEGRECLYSFLFPLLVASMEFAEGEGNWEEGWKFLRGEEEILQVRKNFGQAHFANLHKFILWESPCFIKYDWKIDKKTWEEVKEIALPEDLGFIREILRVCLKKLAGKVESQDYLDLARRYKKLWLRERKEEGLGRIYARFWYVAGQREGGFKLKKRKAQPRHPSFNWIVEPDSD